jgi:hypothetical protein
VTSPDLEDPETGGRYERVLEGVLIAVIVVLATYLGTSDLLRTLHGGALTLAGVFYPLIVLAIGGLAWTRRTPG